MLHPLQPIQRIPPLDLKQAPMQRRKRWTLVKSLENLAWLNEYSVAQQCQTRSNATVFLPGLQ